MINAIYNIIKIMTTKYVIFTDFGSYDDVPISDPRNGQPRTESIYDYLIKNCQQNKEGYLLKKEYRNMPDNNLLLNEVLKYMTIDEFKQIPYKRVDYIKEDGSALFIWTDEKIINIFKNLKKYTIKSGCSISDLFIFVEIKNEYINYISFNIHCADCITKNKNITNNIVIVVLNKVDDCRSELVVCGHIDIIKYIKDTVEKYKNSDEILKHITNLNDIFKYY